MTREDDALIEVDVQAGDMPAKDDNDCNDVVEEQTNPNEFDSWDPFKCGGANAP